MRRHWEINKTMDPGCTNLLIDRILEVIDPYIYGGKMCGAGGGGFMEVIAREKGMGVEIERILTQ